ncbi:hypothetical protein PINS_up008838 [Pythium insidiosum]|nr:hypothetical protein PINS_up008838 [Pythium insidiosum]
MTRRSISLLLSLLALALVPLASAFPLGWFDAHTHTHKHTHGDTDGDSAGDRALRKKTHDWDALRLNAKFQQDSHAYFRPTGDEVSGRPKNDRKYHRAPCPCMNSLANHGYLPRDGKNLTPEMIKRAVVEVFNIDEGLAATLVSPLPPTLTLADLGVHNFIEHDASMVHDDLFFGNDPAQINMTLADELLHRAGPSGRLTKREIAHFRHDREKECARTDPQYEFGPKKQAATYAGGRRAAAGHGRLRERVHLGRRRAFVPRGRAHPRRL